MDKISANKKHGITVRNLYTVKCGGIVSGAYNDIDTNFFSRAMNNPDWAKYFVVTDSKGRRVSLKATLVSVNSDPSRGMMKAVYSGELPTVRGYEYTRVSLYISPNDSSEMTGSEVEFTGDGEKAQISATINITEDTTVNVRFCSGDNTLVRTFLGCGATATYMLGWGKCDYPAKTCSRDIKGFTLQSPRMMLTKNYLAFAGMTAGTGTEIVIFADDRAVVRAVLPFTYNLRSFGEVVSSGLKYKRFNANIPEEIVNIMIGSDSLTTPDICPEYYRADELKTDFNIALGSGSYVTSDPVGQYVGVVSNGYVEVYKADVPMLERVARVKRTDEYAEILRGGEVALWSKTELKIFSVGGGDNPVFRMAVNNPTLKCVLKVGTYYHAMYDEGNTFKRIRVDGNGEVTVLDTFTVSNKALWFISRCGDYIAYGSGTLTVKSVTGDESADYSCTALNSSSASFRDLCGVGDCFMLCMEYGVTVLYDFITNSRKEMSLNSPKCLGKLVYGSGKLYTYCYGIGLKELTCDEDLSGLSSAAIAGDGLYAVIDGKLRVFYLSRVGLTLRLPKYAEGKTVRGTVRERVPSGSGKRANISIVSQ